MPCKDCPRNVSPQVIYFLGESSSPGNINFQDVPGFPDRTVWTLWRVDRGVERGPTYSRFWSMEVVPTIPSLDDTLRDEEVISCWEGGDMGSRLPISWLWCWGGPLYHQIKERKKFTKRYFYLCINITNKNNFVIQIYYKFVYMYLIGLTVIFKSNLLPDLAKELTFE